MRKISKSGRTIVELAGLRCHIASDRLRQNFAGLMDPVVIEKNAVGFVGFENVLPEPRLEEQE